MNRFRFFWFAICLAFWAAPCLSAESASLKLVTENLRPYAYTQDGKLMGLSVDIVRALEAKLNLWVPIDVEPWARGYTEALSPSSVGLFTVARTRAREHLFQWVGPFASDQVYFYKLRNSPIHWNTMADAKHLRVLATRDYPEVEVLQALGFKNVYNTVDPATNWKMLKAQRGDLTVSGAKAFRSIVEAIPLSTDLFERIGPPLFQTDLYLAFSLATPAGLVNRWKTAWDELKASGELAAMVRRYADETSRK